MRTKKTEGRAMITATDDVEDTRPFVVALVRWHQARAGSRMAAYGAVASVAGSSATWVRRMIGRYPGVAVSRHQYLNIVEAYRATCARIEAEADRERTRFLELKEAADAAAQSLAVPVVVETPADRGGNPPERTTAGQ